jgi:urocanate hydratase
MGPLCFDYGFGPFRWVCTSGAAEDLQQTDAIAQKVLQQMLAEAPTEIQPQLNDNLRWIREAGMKIRDEHCCLRACRFWVVIFDYRCQHGYSTCLRHKISFSTLVFVTWTYEC